MTRAREDLIDGLVADLKPVARPGKIGAKTFTWLLCATFVAVALMLARGPFRAGFPAQLLEHLRFAVESSIGAVAIVVLAVAALRSAIPGPRPGLAGTVLPYALALLWTGFYVYGLHEPAVPIAMAGKRAHCYLEVLLVGLPALVFGLFMLRALYPLRGVRSGALIGLAAGLIPALAMQFACMYIPAHILSHHVLPGSALSIVGALGGWLILKAK